jgi:hypothetical protein
MQRHKARCGLCKPCMGNTDDAVDSNSNVAVVNSKRNQAYMGNIHNAV